MRSRPIHPINVLLFNKNKCIAAIQGTILVLIISLLFAYIRGFLPFESKPNIKSINTGIAANIYRVLLPLLLSPIIEELIFRKWIPNAFQDVLGRKRTILFSNLLFAFFHLDVYFLPYLANGLIYSLYYEKTKDLKVSITMHILYNMSVFLITFV